MYHTTIENNIEITQSAGGIVYRVDEKGENRILLLKRQSMSGKVERVSPKGKIYTNEPIESAAVREVGEETGIPAGMLSVKGYAGSIHIRSKTNPFGTIDKDMNYYLMCYTGDPDAIVMTDGEGFMGEYKRYTLKEVFDTIYFPDMKKIMLNVHQMLQKGGEIII